MKNETARREIESLDYYLQNHTDDYSEESHTAMMMAIKALEQEPCDNAVSRQDVLDLAKKGVLISNGNYESVCKAINEIPSAEPKTGHWIIDKDDRRKWDRYRFYCSECGKWQTYGKTKYCLHCGAKMIEPKERNGEE